MAEKKNPLALDLSHWDPADDYDAVRREGYVGIIFKATEGQSYTDDTYTQQQRAAKQAGLCWGSYHFADASDVLGQIENYMRFAAPDPDELFCLDWEDNPTGNGRMSVDDAKIWIREVERRLNRPGQCVIYSGNTAKEQIHGNDPFFGSRRLWLAHYTDNPTWQQSWDTYWLWQYTETGHVNGVDDACDINSYKGTADQLRGEWATGTAGEPAPEPEPVPVVTISIEVPVGVDVQVTINGDELVTRED